MSLSGIVSSMTSKVEAALGTSTAPTTDSSASADVVGTASAGAQMAQGGGGPGDPGGGSLVKKMLIGGVVGAGVGFGASFLTLPIVGQVAAPIAAAVGGAIGALGGLAVHLIGKRRQNLAMQAQAQAAEQQAMQPTTNPGTAAGLREGARGPAAKKLQGDLVALGLYSGRRTNTYDTATQEAVRRYEVMKGVVPTGKATSELRAAVAQDVSLVRQYA